MKKVLLCFLFFISVPICFCSENSKVFSWKDCEKYALHNNSSILISKEYIEQSLLDVKLSKKENSFKIDFSMSANKNYIGDKSDLEDRTSISLNKVLFDNGKVRFNVKSLEEISFSKKYEYDEVLIDIRLALRLAFINLYYAQENLKLTKEIYLSRKNNYELVMMNYESGLENKGSVLTAKVKLLSAEYDIEKAELDIKENISALKNIIGLDIDISDKEVSIKSKLLEKNIEEKPDFSKILNEHSSIKALQTKKLSKNFDMKIIERFFTPTFLFSYSLSQTDDTFFSDEDINQNIGLMFSLPLYQGNIRKANLLKAKADIKIIDYEVKNKEMEIMNNLESSFIELKKSILDLEISKESLNAARVRSEITKSKYSIGLVSFDDWIIIEDNYITSKKDLLLKKIEILNREAKWMHAKGVKLGDNE